MSFQITDACTGCGACMKICPTGAISGEKKKKHVIAEDLCIECGACGRICPKEAVLDQLGNRCTPVKRSQWKKPVLDLSRCCSCTICEDACPLGCIALCELGMCNKHRYPSLIKPELCIACGFCVTDCPQDALTMI
ncbi:MAG: 4Fe-4S binding protein [Deltaproteobacteria bacterium]|nr:4Fe-4S binding protein [Deltaproteobacteria bacterium]